MILDLFAKDNENLVNNDKIDPSKVTLQECLDSLVLKEFAHKKDAPFWKELLELSNRDTHTLMSALAFFCKLPNLPKMGQEMLHIRNNM